MLDGIDIMTTSMTTKLYGNNAVIGTISIQFGACLAIQMSQVSEVRIGAGLSANGGTY